MRGRWRAPAKAASRNAKDEVPRVRSFLQGIRFRVRRTGNGQNGDGRRGVRGSARRPAQAAAET